MRPGRALVYGVGGLSDGRTPPDKPTVESKPFHCPKASSTAKSGKGAPKRGSTTCGLFPCEVK